MLQSEEGGRYREIAVERNYFTLLHYGYRLKSITLASLSGYYLEDLGYADRGYEKRRGVFDCLLERLSAGIIREPREPG